VTTEPAAQEKTAEPTTKTEPAAPQNARSSIFSSANKPATHWADSLPEELRGNAELRKFKDSTEALKAYVNLVPMIGRKGLAAPADLNDQAAMDAYFKARRGSVESPEAYSRKFSSEDLVGMDKEAFDTVSAYMFANGFSDIEHGKTLDLIAGLREREAARWEQENEARYQKCVRDLKNEWGDEYDANLQKVNNFMSKFPGALKSLQTYGLENDAEMCRMFLAAARGVSEASKPRDSGAMQSPKDLLKEIDSLMKEKSFSDPNSPGFALSQRRFNDLMVRKAELRAKGLL
jgi:hypothetical protein